MDTNDNITDTWESIEQYVLAIAGFGFELVIAFAAAILTFLGFCASSLLLSKRSLKLASWLLWGCSMLSMGFRLFTLQYYKITLQYLLNAQDVITWAQLVVAFGSNYSHTNALLRWVCLIGQWGSVTYDSIIYIVIKHESLCRAEGVCSETVQTYTLVEYTPTPMLHFFEVAYLVSCSLDIMILLLLCFFVVRIGYCSSSRVTVGTY